MKAHLHSFVRIAAVVLAAGLVSLPALADKPDWAGGGKHREAQRDEERQDRGRHDERERYQRHAMSEPRFSDDDRRSVRDYYGTQFRKGKCPPGLAKKNNGCMPPGQAKKWAIGERLPADLRRYPLPNDVIVRLPVPPAGHEFVRVASDILLISVGTGMVIDAIADLGR